MYCGCVLTRRTLSVVWKPLSSFVSSSSEDGGELRLISEGFPSVPLSAAGEIRKRIPVEVGCALDVVSGREEFTWVETILAVNLLSFEDL
jgi:hypothetical protein